MISPPSFWYHQNTLPEILLKIALMPFGWIYGALVRKKFDLYYPIPMAQPVICVGNLTAGGAGKTPVVLALAELLKEKGYNPHLLTRGYGGKEAGPLQVSPGRDTAYDVGDEALLLVEKAPTWVSAKRPLGAQAAIESGASVVIMDDGFQNAVIYKDFSFLVIDGAVGLGNRQVLPAGPLRERMKFGLSRADAIVIIGEDKTRVTDLVRRYTKVPVLSASILADEDNPEVAGKKVVAFAGIGRPEKLRESLLAAGAEIVAWHAFPDHYPYDEEDLRDIVTTAAAEDALIITTAKDHVRVPNALRPKIQKFSIHLVWQNPDEIVPMIARALQKRTL